MRSRSWLSSYPLEARERRRRACQTTRFKRKGEKERKKKKENKKKKGKLTKIHQIPLVPPLDLLVKPKHGNISFERRLPLRSFPNKDTARDSRCPAKITNAALPNFRPRRLDFLLKLPQRGNARLGSIQSSLDGSRGLLGAFECVCQILALIPCSGRPGCVGALDLGFGLLHSLLLTAELKCLGGRVTDKLFESKVEPLDSVVERACREHVDVLLRGASSGAKNIVADRHHVVRVDDVAARESVDLGSLESDAVGICAHDKDTAHRAAGVVVNTNLRRDAHADDEDKRVRVFKERTGVVWRPHRRWALESGGLMVAT